MSHSVTATTSNSRNSSSDATYLRNLLSFFIVFLLLICLLILPQRADRRTAAQTYGNADHHAQADIVRQGAEEDAKAQADGTTKGECRWSYSHLSDSFDLSEVP